MEPTVESSKRVLIECSSLTVEERDALEAFLQKQPKVASVSHWVRARNPHPPDSDTLGLLFHLSQAHHDLVVEFANTVAAGLTVVVLQKLIEAWWKKSGKIEALKARQQEENLTVVVIGDANAVTVVKTPPKS